MYFVKGLTKNECDITNIINVNNNVSIFLPDIIINAAAYTNVDSAEKYVLDAININATGVENIIRSMENKNILFIHYSTDYVFDGNTSIPYHELSKRNPINSYGISKYMGERLIENFYNKYYILRTSWVYDNYNVNNFPNKILNRYLEEKDIQIVKDQKGSPTHVNLISKLTESLILKYNTLSESEKYNSYGTYHATSRGQTSWYDFSRYIIEKHCIKKKVKINYKKIHACSSDKFQSIASRPLNSVLDCSKLEQFLSLKIPTWQYYADKFMEKKYE